MKHTLTLNTNREIYGHKASLLHLHGFINVLLMNMYETPLL